MSFEFNVEYSYDLVNAVKICVFSKIRNSVTSGMKLTTFKFAACIIILTRSGHTVRLNKLFQFIDGFRSEYNLRGFLHVGEENAVFLRVPKPHDKFLTYELYEARSDNDLRTYKPRLLAISKVPVEYIKEQLKIFRQELYRAKYVDANVVPGTEVMTLREWQIQRAIQLHNEDGLIVKEKPHVLRTVL